MQNEFENLHKFIANNYDLEKLEAKLNEFNPLKVIKADHYEIRHSNIISWLLNPKENHNLGDAFLKKFLAEVIINNENMETSYTVFNTQEMSFHDCEIKREWNHIDIFLVSHVNKLAIIIENKIHSIESKGQLEKYYKTVSSEFSGYQIVPVFLSLNGTMPSDNRYGIVSYVEVLHMLKFITLIQKENLNTKVLDFIIYYLKILEMLTMEDDEIKRLCKKIYKEHQEALDLIYEYAEDTAFEESAHEFIKGLKATEISNDGRSAWFIPNKIKNHVKMVGEKSWCGGYPVALWYTAQEEKLGIIIEVGPFIDGSLRREFLEHLKKHNFRISDRSFKPSARYTRIFTKYPKFDDWDDRESIIQKMDDLYNKTAQKAVDNLTTACANFDWKVA